MPTVTTSAELPADRQTVWSLVTDTSRRGEWNVAHVGFPDGPPQLEPEAKFKEKLTIMGMPGEADWTVKELEAPTRVVLDGVGPMGIMLGQKIELSGDGGATRVSLETSFDGGPLAGPLGATVAQSAEKAAAESLNKLKALVA